MKIKIVGEVVGIYKSIEAIVLSDYKNVEKGAVENFTKVAEETRE